MKMRVGGEGQPGANGGPAGDLYVFLAVQPHPIFERREYDLHCTVPINIAQAALGYRNPRAHLRRPRNHQGPRRHPVGRNAPPPRQGRPVRQRRRPRRPRRPHRSPHPRASSPANRSDSSSNSAKPCPPKTSPKKRASWTSSKTTSCNPSAHAAPMPTPQSRSTATGRRTRATQPRRDSGTDLCAASRQTKAASFGEGGCKAPAVHPPGSLRDRPCRSIASAVHRAIHGLACIRIP